MTIPDEAVQAAARKDAEMSGRTFDALSASEKKRYLLRSQEQLTAALPFLTGVKVKALEWAGYGDGLKSSAFGVSAFYGISGSPGNWTVTWPGEDRYIHTSGFKTQIEAKAAAQADYEARILSAIEVSGNPGQLEQSPRAQALEEALRNILHAVCGETGFANAVRQVSGLPWPWPSLDIAEADAIRTLSQPVADGWLPIETAPKDGTVIQAWHEVHKCPVSVLWKDDGFPYKGERLNWYERSYTTAWPERAFTHWRPLPASPGASE